jgi:hypothetical protein
MTLVEGTSLTALAVPCSLTKDETDGYTPAKNAILQASVVELDPSTFAFELTANNTNSYSVKIDYIIYNQNGTINKEDSKVVAPGLSTIESFLTSSDYEYKVVSTQSWEPTAGDNAGKDSVYENTIESLDYTIVIVQTTTPTVSTPECFSDGGYNYLRVSVTNNDSVEAVIKVGQATLGTLDPGQTSAYIINEGFNTPYSYNFTITATATGKTQSTGVTRSGTITICFGF